MLITFDNLSFEYGDQIIFENLSFSTWQGNVVRIIGSNGSGKTTLLKTIAGIHKAKSGRVLLDGKSELSKVSYLGHKLGLNLELSVIDNIIFWAELNDSVELIRAALSYFKLGVLADEKCCNLSQGQLKRVALARLMVVPSNIWVLDEPEINLDPEFQERLFHVIRVRAMEGGIIFIASHLSLPIENMISIHMDYFAPILEGVE
ncbi:heme ABC exporter ATP-binding protein CcmA [Rickettsiales endosymbiont of Stachyamoeba lipophora]|uniref:heme ABC exporter ATP-binding protein CcmA n=1 Tax=Rickettsiales endosymbiont of Stachyamoeba lipophora TaxID=2486578 RepID=UPI000F648899|nr:heme ABC exporter ATP-binding protein CcmA [Rickettsiales endosymbiont of Stachyamoeba lipophora]AZL15164.1 heme ABC exporter ATP-binding protein CcmA [Rickettsiales endosymbiont of Stachyamoeba lipophora]